MHTYAYVLICLRFYIYSDIKEHPMTAQRWTVTLAGAFIILSLVLAHLSGTINMSGISWLWFTAFVGLNLFQSGITGFCPLTKILRAVGAE